MFLNVSQIAPVKLPTIALKLVDTIFNNVTHAYLRRDVCSERSRERQSRHRMYVYVHTYDKRGPHDWGYRF